VWDAVDKARDNSEDILSRHEAISALLGLSPDGKAKMAQNAKKHGLRGGIFRQATNSPGPAK
jgi:hypothetical protein